MQLKANGCNSTFQQDDIVSQRGADCWLGIAAVRQARLVDKIVFAIPDTPLMIYWQIILGSAISLFPAQNMLGSAWLNAHFVVCARPLMIFRSQFKLQIMKNLALLSPSERKQAGMLMIMILIVAFLDMLGVASILPFMAVLANPEVVQTKPVLNTVFIMVANLHPAAEQFCSPRYFGLCYWLSLCFRRSLYTQTRFALMREYSIGKHKWKVFASPTAGS